MTKRETDEQPASARQRSSDRSHGRHRPAIDCVDCGLTPDRTNATRAGSEERRGVTHMRPRQTSCREKADEFLHALRLVGVAAVEQDLGLTSSHGFPRHPRRLSLPNVSYRNIFLPPSIIVCACRVISASKSLWEGGAAEATMAPSNA